MRHDLNPGLTELVEIRLIKPSTRPLREKLGPVEDLAASIAEKGLLEPIVVRRIDHGFEVVAGNRRLAACRFAGAHKILCHIMDLNEKEAFETALVENLQHQTLNPIEEARAYKAYVDQYGYGAESELARRIGKSEQYVSQRVRLLSLSEDVLAKVTSRLVSFSHAAELIGLDEREQVIVSEAIISRRLSSKSVRKIRSNLKNGLDEFSATDFDSQLHTVAGDRVQRMLGKCIVILQATLVRLDDMASRIEGDDWVARETVRTDCSVIREQIDVLTRLRVKLRRNRYLEVA